MTGSKRNESIDSNRSRVMKREGKLEDDHKVKYEKYKAAQVGLFRSPATRSKKPNSKRKRNDLFSVLREQKIGCFSVKDVDSSL
jgi:hypothetical protein